VEYVLGIACLAWTLRETACLISGVRARRPTTRSSVFPPNARVIELGPGDSTRLLGRG
jgi:hypothetical protein